MARFHPVRSEPTATGAPRLALIRRLGAAGWLAGRHIRSRLGDLALVWLGIAAAAAMLAAVQAGALVAQDRSLTNRIAGLQPSVRTVRALSFGAPGQLEVHRSLNEIARRELLPLLGIDPVATVLYRETTVANSFLGIGAVDGLSRWVHLRSGRMPAPCRPSHCEVLLLRGGGRIPNTPGLRLVPVGRAELADDTLFADAVPPTRRALPRTQALRKASRYHRPAPPPLVLADGVAGLVSSPRLTSYRTYGWVVPIPLGALHPWNVDAFGASVDDARATLLAGTLTLNLSAPGDELRLAADASAVAGRRLLVLGGQACALLVAFALLAAVRRRRVWDARRRRLRWLATPPWLVGVVILCEIALVAVTATAAGWALGSGVAALTAERAGSPAGAILAHSTFSVSGIALAVALAAVVTGVLALGLAARPIAIGGLAVSPVEIAALAAVVVVAVALLRGQADAGALLRDRGTGIVLLILPGLVVFAAAVLVSRLLAPLLRALARGLPNRRVAARFAALSLARHPGSAAIQVGFLVVSIGLALFAETYRPTLEAGQRDQAAFEVPADFVLREDLSRLVPVQRAVGPAAPAALGSDVTAGRVVRVSGSVAGFDRLTGISVLGLDESSVEHVDGWRSDFGSLGPDDVARRIAPAETVRPRGPIIPIDARTLSVVAKTAGRPVTLTALVAGTGGAVASVTVGEVTSSPRRLSARLPPAVRGGRLAALRIVPPPRIIEGGADAGVPARGVLTLGLLVVAGEGGRAVLTRYGDWLGTPGAQPPPDGTGARIRYTLTNQVETYFRPRQPTDGIALPAVVTTNLAGLADKSGVLPLQLAGERIPVRVVGSVRRFPGAGDQAVVVDRRALSLALETARPGTGRTNELWLDAPPDQRAAVAGDLRRPPFDLLALDSQQARLHQLEVEPIAHASLLMLAVAAAASLALAIAGLVLGLIADLRDERRELFYLEAEGLEPATLRRQQRLRAAATALCGLVGGLVTAALLSRLVVELVALTANATSPEPPLVVRIDPLRVGLALAVLVVVGAVLVYTTTATAFRAPEAGRPTGETP